VTRVRRQQEIIHMPLKEQEVFRARLWSGVTGRGDGNDGATPEPGDGNASRERLKSGCAGRRVMRSTRGG
jgi:hypothetical protein